MSDTLLGALAKREDVKDLVAVSNNAGGGDSGLGELLKYVIVKQYLTTTEDKLINTNQLSKIIASYPGRSSHYSYASTHRILNYAFFQCSNKNFETRFLSGKITLELVPQGTLAERMRAHAAGIPAFFTPTGASTAVEEGTIPQRYKEGGAVNGIEIPGIPKEAREINGKRYILETALGGDVAFIRAWKVDEAGNCVFRYATHEMTILIPIFFF